MKPVKARTSGSMSWAEAAKTSLNQPSMARTRSRIRSKRCQQRLDERAGCADEDLA